VRFRWRGEDQMAKRTAMTVKLTGDQNVIDRAAEGLRDFAADVDASNHGSPSALVVVTATGGGGKRTDRGSCRADLDTRAVAVNAWPTAAGSGWAPPDGRHF
jgi:hypothetical protein